MSKNHIQAIQAVKGMNDLLPDQSPLWEWFEDTCRGIFRQYGYRLMRTPIVEPTPLFVRSIGEVTDIVEKEMYSFEDKLNGDPLTLRPEATAGLLRAAIEHSLIYNGPQRVWTSGAMFRHEAPQQGRLRQFHQFDVEALGYAGPNVDAEQMLMLGRLWKALGLLEDGKNSIQLEINSIGDTSERNVYREKLIAHFEANVDALDEEGKRRLHTNPLRLLDSKAEKMQSVIEKAPKLLSFLGDETRAHFDAVQQMLSDAGQAFVINPRLVRGLDYYNRTVFEWVSKAFSRPLTIAAGGRYDGLFEELGSKKPAPGVGFGVGVERVLMHFNEQQKENPRQQPLDCFVIYASEHAGEAVGRYAFTVAESLRNAGLSAQLSAGGSFKSQMKRADASYARFAIILGDSEFAAKEVAVKSLRETDHGGLQQTVALSRAIEIVLEANL